MTTYDAIGPLPSPDSLRELGVRVDSFREGGGYGSLRRDIAVLGITSEEVLDRLRHRGVSLTEAPEAAPVESSEAPLHLLDLSVKKLRAALRAEPLSASALRALLAAEKAGKTRATAVALLEEALDA
tara:strand:- start:2301 stop:2681 length:381 start_codon:yes stop_codon:yes gene_type:complete